MAARKKQKPAKKPTPKKKPLAHKKAAAKKRPVATKKPASKKPRAAAAEPDETSPEYDEVFEIFSTYDRDHSGTIDSQELARLLEALGQDVSDDELLIALDVVDTDATGRISWSEFKAWWTSR